MTAHSFSLEKWYLDWVGPDGSAAIGYHARLRWRGVSIGWQQLTEFPADGPPRRRSALAHDPAPARTAVGVEWIAKALDARYEVRTGGTAIDEVLLRDERGGAVRWCCEVPCGTVQLAHDDETRTGVGYVERLTLDILPWELPIRELRWGRWMDAAGSRSVVWIDWRDATPRTWVYLDGAPVTEPSVTDEAVRGATFLLDLRSERTLVDHAFSDIVGRIAPLRRLVPDSLLAMRQRTWLATGELSTPAGAPPLSGMAIQEVVVFP